MNIILMGMTTQGTIITMITTTGIPICHPERTAPR
jgi:hypothetical protein